MKRLGMNNFLKKFADILNAEQSRSVIFSGNVYDLFYNGKDYVPLIPFLCEKTRVGGLIHILYELNGPITIVEGKEHLKKAWRKWRDGDVGQEDIDAMLSHKKAEPREKINNAEAEFETRLRQSNGNSTMALEFLRQLTMCSREVTGANLFVIIEGADMLIPTGKDLSSLNDVQRRRIGIVQDWFSDPDFVNGGDSVCLIAESASLIHSRVSKLPQVLDIEISSPDFLERKHYIDWFCEENKPKLWGRKGTLASLSAGLSLHSIRQLLKSATSTKIYKGVKLEAEDVVAKVESFIQHQIGEDVVEFKKPEHCLADVVGFTNLKKFIYDELIPRFQASGDAALPGAAVAGPIGGGKTFIFEAVAAELGMPVLVLKNIRSQWFGQTDVIFERLRRVLEALQKVVIFVDEADTQFGGVGKESHTTERRLTGKIQAMMSDPKLRGKVIWLLMTARIHLLSPDIRRPGRVGDLIIPVLDPEGEDREAFVDFVLSATYDLSQDQRKKVIELTKDYSAAAFASLRSYIKARMELWEKGDDSEEKIDIVKIIGDQIPANIGLTREYQTLQALTNCTRLSLIPKSMLPETTKITRQLNPPPAPVSTLLTVVPGITDAKEEWERRIKELEAQGIN